MKVVKKSIKIVFKVLISFVSFLIVYLLLAYVLSRVPVNKDVIQKEAEIEIFILSNGVHTDIVVPVKNEFYNWSKQIKFENTISKDSTSNYLAIGWGDKGFYLNTPTWADLKFSTAFKAATGMSTSAMHCTFYKHLKENDRCKSILISETEYKQLILFIQNSFEVKENQFSKIETSAVYGKNDAFYEAKGSYSLFYTCNTWANCALKSANQKAAFWTPYEGGIFCHYQ